MPDAELSPEVALSLIRALSGMENYPFRLEGEQRLAGVLIEYAPAVGHARLVIEEFDGERCPSVEALRSTAIGLAEKCRCGRALWQHRDSLPDCKRFYSASSLDLPGESAPPVSLEETAKRLRVPILPSVPWFVSLQVECLRLAGANRKSDFVQAYDRDYPEAMYDAGRGIVPDPGYVERRMRELHPHLFARTGNRIAGKTTTVERIGDVA